MVKKTEQTQESRFDPPYGMEKVDTPGVEDVRWAGQITGQGNPGTPTFTGEPSEMDKVDINKYRGY